MYVDYFKEREIKALEKLNLLLNQLPPFCKHFFVGIAHTTSSQTRVAYAYDLKVFFQYLGSNIDEFLYKPLSDFTLANLELITAMDVQLFLEFVTARTSKGKGSSQTTLTNSNQGKMRKLATLRSFFAYYFKHDQISKNIMPKIDMPKIKDKPIIRLEQNEVATLLDAPLETEENTSIRDYTMLLLFLSSGIRVSELVGLNIADINLENKSFRITRKGGEQVILYMTDELVGQLQDYLDHITKNDNQQPPPSSPLFITRLGKRISVRSVQLLVKKYADSAVPLKNITPHKLRSTFGTRLYHQTGDIYVVADVLGHKDVNTTKKHYAAITEDIRRQAVKKLDILSE